MRDKVYMEWEKTYKKYDQDGDHHFCCPAAISFGQTRYGPVSTSAFGLFGQPSIRVP
jgi:hypothetical protein